MKLTREMAFKKGIWSPEEDRKLIAYINRYGIWYWCKMAEPAGLLRSGKSCRLRWRNYLRPGIIHGNYTSEEEETIIRMHKALGNKWAKIAAALPGRTDNEIKNHWHTQLKKLPEKPLIKQTQVSGSNGNKNTVESSELDPVLLPKYDSGEVSILPMLYGPSSSSDAASVETSETEQNIEAVTDHFWERLYLESLTMVSNDSGSSANYYSDEWEPGPQSPLGLYNVPHKDFWPNPTDMDATLDAVINFE